jgi:hypothetical protein
MVVVIIEDATERHNIQPNDIQHNDIKQNGWGGTLSQ